MIPLKIKVDKVIQNLLVLLMTLMVLNVLWQVFTRFIMNDPSSFTDELSRYLLIWLGLLGAAYVTGQKMHLAIDYLLNKTKPKVKGILEYVINISILLFALFVLVIGGFNLVSLTLYLKQISAALQIQLGYVYIVLPLSGLLIMFYSAVNIIQQYKENN
ncbi:TRAP-type transport system, small permease component, predicted N-acetylneuraminate transporter [hydrothermal vent metagenome]|uniref:TRAP-type transport system, small permease component, predicted N-acetylneuraminate transporter n=1 Tax=hydrothermal vent metagenome TaxID=652676 RepID=A0A3B1BPV6_9ZZZZ